ncbi:hypothetical protein JXA40_06625 [bacterium]|nr:hypothetical protein [candidate division CSSED10-310 bacterium]
MKQDNRVRIGDLIEVPEVQTVIEIADTRDLDPDDPVGRAALEQLANTFVVTEDIREILAVIFPALSCPEGRGFFITGNYGSGKSHLLSVLTLALKYNWARTTIAGQDPDLAFIGESVAGKRYLPVVIALTDFTADLSLEEIVWGSVEVTAASEGIPLLLSHTRRFLSLFDRYILPVHQADFSGFLARRLGREYSWERIQREDPASAHTLIHQYLDDREEPVPFKVAPDRRTVMDELIRSLRNSNWDGVVLVIDELSEFLKSKPDVQSLNEDTRYLQFLGEISRHLPIWIIAALQENLERTGDIPEPVFKKIKDRYSHRLRLTSKHLRQLVSRRLIRRKGDPTEIKAVFETIRRAFNRINLGLDEFIQIYPVHPETLELLDKNSDLFSQRRGIVDFLNARIRGRPEDNIPGILGEPPDHLLTPDVIFDHFQDRLSDSPRFSRFHQAYTGHFQPRITGVFTDPADRECALRIIKILILLAISPLKETRTVRELADMILYRTIDASLPAGDINYEYFHDRILSEILRKIGHLRLISGQTVLDNIYTLDIDTQASETLDFQIQRQKRDLSPLSVEIVRTAYATLAHGKFPLALILNRTGERDSVRWENTIRRVGVTLSHAGEIRPEIFAGFREKLRSADLDFILVLGWLGDLDNQKLSLQGFLAKESAFFSGNWGFCLPSIPENPDMLDAFLELFICRRMAQDLADRDSAESPQLLRQLNDRIGTLLPRIQRTMMHCYLSGTLYLASGYRKLHPDPGFDHFDQWISSILKPAFAARFPDHHQVAPEMEFSGRILMDLLLEKFILPGRIGEIRPGRDDTLESALNRIVMPLGMATRVEKEYLLSVSARNCAGAKAIMDRIPPVSDDSSHLLKTEIPLDELRTDLASSSMGMSKPVFDLTVLGLIRKGYLEARNRDTPVPLGEIILPPESSITHLTRGPIIPPALRPAFAMMHKIITGRTVKEIDLDVQDQNWAKLKKLAQRWRSGLVEFQSALDDLLKQYPGDAPDLDETTRILERVASWIDLIESEMDPFKGWLRLLPVVADTGDFQEKMDGFKALIGFVQIGINPYISARNYLNDPRLHIPDAPEYDLLKLCRDPALKLQPLNDALFMSVGLKEFLKAFETFRHEYSAVYTREHQLRVQAVGQLDPADLPETVEYRVLQRLARISPVSVRHDLTSVRQQYEHLRQAKCLRNPELELERAPVCACGYCLGRHTSDLPEMDLRQTATTGIRQYLAAMRSQPVAERLLRILDTIPDRHRKAVQYLVREDSMSVQEPDLAMTIDSIIDDEFAEYLHSRLWVDLTVHDRKLSGLNQQLKNRRLSFGEAQKIVQSWLSGDADIPDTDLIRFDE